MMRYVFIGIFFIVFSCMAGATQQYIYVTDTDREIYERYISAMEAKKGLPAGELLVETARYFLETPYVAATLEKEPEGLVVNLREMDCSTFVETVFSLVRTLQGKDTSFDAYCRNLQMLRYRNNSIGDYTDRLHYTSDWIYENERKGLVKDVTREAGGELLPLSLSFMSTHPESYKQLKENPEYVKIIAEKEEEINARTYYFIPEEKISSLSREIRSGDMIGFVTTIKGLDLSHVGIAYRTGETLTFIHASSTGKKVIVNEESLADYVRRIKNNKGIMVVRYQP